MSGAGIGTEIAKSLGLDIGRADHFAPLGGFVSNELAELDFIWNTPPAK
jgi:hypothetical protein